MTDNKQFEINLTKTYTANLSAIINLFRDNTIFELTGANEIESDFNVPVSFISHLGIEELFMDNLSKSKKMN
ncbi:MAG: hypothetical protein IPG90_08480 [Bacteroidetes bacterium]|nr:hypothetical protein [Bacteroidota bacterium]